MSTCIYYLTVLGVGGIGQLNDIVGMAHSMRIAWRVREIDMKSRV